MPKEKSTKPGHKVDNKKSASSSSSGSFFTLPVIALTFLMILLSLSTFFYIQQRRAAAAVDDANDLYDILDPSLSFQNWPTAGKVILHASNVGMVYRKLKGLGFALQAIEKIDDNQPVLSIPYDSCITGVTLKYLSLESYQTLGQSKNSAFTQIIAALLIERAKGVTSLWYSWFEQVVPKFKNMENMFTWTEAMLQCQNKAVHSMFSRTDDMILKILGKLHQLPHEVLKKATVNDVYWGYTVLTTRGWEHPAPYYFVIPPIADLTNVRSLSNEFYTKLKTPVRVNCNVKFDPTGKRVVLQTSTPVEKGQFLFSPFNAERMMPTDSVRLFGVLDPLFELAPSYSDFGQLEGCNDRHAFYFNVTSGEPSKRLLECARLYANEAEAGKKTYTFLQVQVGRILEEMHTKANVNACEEVDRSKHKLVARMEKLLHAGYTKVKTYIDTQVSQH
eukprot:PhF_6_TR27823/c0_g1_i1/m.40587